MWDRDGYRLAMLSRLMSSTTGRGQGTQRHGSRGPLGWWQPSSTGGRSVCDSGTSLQQCLAWTEGFVPPWKTGAGCSCWVFLSTWHFSPVCYQISVLEDTKWIQITSVCVLLKYSTLSRTKQSGFGCGVKRATPTWDAANLHKPAWATFEGTTFSMTARQNHS